jgi:proline-specific peptidase
MRDASFWTFNLFVGQIDNLIDHLNIRETGFYVIGQSWGGMLAGTYASRRPKGLQKVIICGGPASFPLFIEGGKRHRAQLPRDVREILEKGEKEGDLKSPEYERASEYFYKRHVCRIDPMPEAVKQAFINLKDDPTAYHTM